MTYVTGLHIIKRKDKYINKNDFTKTMVAQQGYESEKRGSARNIFSRGYGRNPELLKEYIQLLENELQRVYEQQKRQETSPALQNTSDLEHFINTCLKVLPEGSLEEKSIEDIPSTIKDGLLTYEVTNDKDFKRVNGGIAKALQLSREKGLLGYSITYKQPGQNGKSYRIRVTVKSWK